MRRWPLRVRIPVVTVALLIAAEIIVGAVAFALVRSTLTDQVDARLNDAVDSLAARGTTEGDVARPLRLPQLPSDYVVLYSNVRGDVVGTVASQVRDRPDAPAVAVQPDSREPYTATDMADGSEWRLVSRPLPRGGRTVTVGLPLADASAATATLLIALGFIVAATAVVGAAVAWGTTRRSLKPLDHVEATARGIAAGDFSRRVPSAPAGTEVGSLAVSLNAMLDRLSAAFAAQQMSEDRLRAFLADVSHELRTPLAAIRGYAELIQMNPDGDVGEAMSRIEGNAVRMGALVEDLLTLARFDQQPTSLGGSELVDMASVAAEAADDARAQDPTQVLTVAAPERGRAIVVGSSRHLRQVTGNLVGNAIRHGGGSAFPHEPIELRVAIDGTRVVVTVRDHGPGIPEAERAKVFDRFHRVDSSRARDSGGSGLGLAIVAAIVAAHRGTVSAVEPQGGGTAIVVDLPLGAAPV